MGFRNAATHSAAFYQVLLVGLGAATSRAGTPFGGDDGGFVPPTAAAAKCASMAHKAGLNYADALFKGHIKLLALAFKSGAAQPDDGPGSIEDTALKQVEATQAKLSNCGPCLTSNFAALNVHTDVSTERDTFPILFCDGSQAAFDGDNLEAFIPTSKAALTCETKFTKAAIKLEDGIVNCSIKFGTARFKGASFDEEGCETNVVQSYRGTLSKLTACPPCVGSCPACDPTTKLCGPCSGNMGEIESGFTLGLDFIFLPQYYCASPSAAFLGGASMF
jgi:hypothetical protein